MKILITGANGFIGGELAERIVSVPGIQTVLVGRRKVSVAGITSHIIVDSIETFSRWDEALADVQIVIHAAAHAHYSGRAETFSGDSDPNVCSTRMLAEAAARQGVRHFIYLSSAGVNGNTSPAGGLQESDAESPHSLYTQSKYEGEKLLRTICARSSMRFTCLRLPLVYGAQARGTFARLLRFVQRMPVTPFGCVRNRRSILFVGNLVEFIVDHAIHAVPSNEVYFLADPQVLSTREILDLIAEGCGKRLLHMPVPPLLMKAALYCVGRGTMYQQLFGDFYLDNGKLARASEWRPRFSAPEALRSIGRNLQTRKES